MTGLRCELRCGDSIDVLARLDAASIDSCVTDPPYGLAFMGKRWDYDVPSVELWTAVFRVLKPGAHVIAFSSPRTYHRMVCAIEDAGFEIRDQLQWLFGSGFPKSVNLGDGRGSALKPANEPIVLARKPLGGTLAACIERHGTGGLEIDACRVATSAADALAMERCNTPGSGRFVASERSDSTYDRPSPSPALDTSIGRWPANVILGCACEAEHEPGCAVAMLDAQSGELPAGRFSGERRRSLGYGSGIASEADGSKPSVSTGDAGGASRFFYTAKASRSERENGLAGLPAKQRGPSRDPSKPGGNNPRNNGAKARANHHPTVKPLDLMRYLCRLVTPKGGTVLDQFMGSGTTGWAARLEGFGFVGIDREPEYVEIARRRIDGSGPLFAEATP